MRLNNNKAESGRELTESKERKTSIYAQKRIRSKGEGSQFNAQTLWRGSRFTKENDKRQEREFALRNAIQVMKQYDVDLQIPSASEPQMQCMF